MCRRIFNALKVCSGGAIDGLLASGRVPARSARSIVADPLHHHALGPNSRSSARDANRLHHWLVVILGALVGVGFLSNEFFEDTTLLAVVLIPQLNPQRLNTR